MAEPRPLPLKAAKATEAETALIFVSIVSYRDPECPHTLLDLFQTAKHPDRVRVGLVLQQAAEDEQDDAFAASPLPEQWAKHVRAVSPHAHAAAGRWKKLMAAVLGTVREWSGAHADTRLQRGRWAVLGEALGAGLVNLSLAWVQVSGGCCLSSAGCFVWQALWCGEEYFLQLDSHMRFRRNWDAYLIETLSACPSAMPVLTTYPIGYHLPNIRPREERPTVLCPKEVSPRMPSFSGQ